MPKVEILTKGAENITIDSVQARMKEQGAMEFLKGTVSRGQQALYDLVVGTRIFFGDNKPAEDSKGVQSMAKTLDQSTRTILNNWRVGHLILTHNLSFAEIKAKGLTLSAMQAHGPKMLKAESWPGAVKAAKDAIKEAEARKQKPRAPKEASEAPGAEEGGFDIETLSKNELVGLYSQCAAKLLKHWAELCEMVGSVPKAVEATDIMLKKGLDSIKEMQAKKAAPAAAKA